MQKYKKGISTGLVIVSTCGGTLTEWFADNGPIWPWSIGFAIGVIILVDAYWPIIPFQWIGWGWSKRTSKFDIRTWRGRDYYRLSDAAALWVGLPPERPDDPVGRIELKRSLLDLAIQLGVIEHDEDNVNRNTPISADSLREYAAKQGEMPEFLK